MQIERCRVSKGRFRVKFIAWLWVLAGVCVGCFMSSGCTPPFNDVLVNDSGEEIRVEAVQRILQDDTLTEQQKREGLMRYGITDEALLDALLRL